MGKVEVFYMPDEKSREKAVSVRSRPHHAAGTDQKSRILDLEDLLSRAMARIAAIESDAVAADDPALGARCYRGHPPEDGRAYVCPGCSYRIGGESAQHRNAVCRGIEFMANIQAEIAELEGREEDAKQLRGFVSAAAI